MFCRQLFVVVRSLPYPSSAKHSAPLVTASLYMSAPFRTIYAPLSTAQHRPWQGHRSERGGNSYTIHERTRVTRGELTVT